MFNSSDGLGGFTVQVVNSVVDYVAMMEEIFDFAAIKRLVSGELMGAPFKMQLDAMCGATGPYLDEIFAVRYVQCLFCESFFATSELHKA